MVNLPEDDQKKNPLYDIYDKSEILDDSYSRRRSFTAASNHGASDKNRETFVLSALATRHRAIFAKLFLSKTINPVT